MKKALAFGAALLVVSACGPSVTTPAGGLASARPAVVATSAATNTPQHSMSPSEMAAMYASPAATAAATAATAAPIATSQPVPPVGLLTAAPAAVTAAPQATTTPATPAPAATTVASGPSTTVNVTLTDAAIKLSTLAVAPGKVTFNVTNNGAVEHEFVVLQTNMPQNAIPVDPTNAALVQEPGLLGKVASLAPKTSGQLSLNLGAGNYVLICNELAHYMALGMHTGFSVR